MIEANHLKKVYPGGVAAVNDNTFCVKRGEVFGLLGPNGAGKSTTFNMCTMDLKRTEGDVKIHSTFIDNLNILGQELQIGMCPQFNTIWDVLTVDECMNFMGAIKGLSWEDTEFVKDSCGYQ